MRGTLMRALVTARIFSLATVMFSMLIVSAQAQSLVNVFARHCFTDDEVPANERDLYEKLAMQFVETLIGDKPEEAYSELTDELRRQHSAEDFVRTVNQTVRPFRPLAGLRIDHSYRESQVTLGSGRSNVPCTAVAHGNVDTPEGRVMIAVLPVPLQAHVIIEGKATNERWAFVLWLFPDQPSWRIGGFYIVPITILDRTATDIWNLARQEQQRGHSLNSYLLYISAAQLAYRGPDLQLGIQPEILREKAALEVPSELKGKPPFEWKFSNGTYHVISIGPIGAGGVFDLRLVHEVAQTEDDQALERQNRALIKAFEDAHPDYAQVFDGLVVQAVMPNGRRFGTVEQKRPRWPGLLLSLLLLLLLPLLSLLLLLLL
jgi:hypothetical protein